MNVKTQLKEVLINLGYPAEKVNIDYPTNSEHGDYSTNLAMMTHNSPQPPLTLRGGATPLEMAENLVAELKKDKFIKETFDKIEPVKPGFINFYLKEEKLLENLEHTIDLGDQLGVSDTGAGKKIVIEYSSPNTNKPLHLGHLRNNFIGMALGNLFKSQGYDVVMTEIVNDRGIHISKSMLAYKL